MVIFLVVSCYTALNLKCCSFFYGSAERIKWEFERFDPLPIKDPLPMLESFTFPC